jgi:hypothetical protein
VPRGLPNSDGITRSAVSDERNLEPEILRGTSDQLMIALAEVSTLERRKRLMPPADPRFPELAREVRRAAERVLELAQGEEAVAGRVVHEPDARTLPPIERMHPARELARILEEWRAVEQKLLAAPPGSDEALALSGEFEAHRLRYADALKQRREG